MHTVNELTTLIRYAYEADASECRYWRGENDDSREYLGLDNLLRVGKLAERIGRAMAWAHNPLATAATRDRAGDDVQVSPLARLRGLGQQVRQ